MHLVQVKKPEESKYKYDYYRVVSSKPGEEVFRPMSEGGCPLVKCRRRPGRTAIRPAGGF